MVLNTINSTEARQNWGKFIDDLVREKPCLVKRNRDVIAALSLDHFQELMKPYQFNLDYEQEEDGSLSGSLQEIDLVVHAQSYDELMDCTAKQLIDYAEEYMEHFNLYQQSPNRSAHFPYIINILIQKSEQDVRNLIHAKMV